MQQFKRQTSLFVLAGVFLFQVVAVLGVYVNGAYPRWNGKELLIRTVPVDPRSLFRGNYARLNYDLSRVALTKSTATAKPEAFREGRTVYVSIKPDAYKKYGWKVTSVSLTAPSEGTFLRGTVRRVYGNTAHIRYGIESFFAKKERALELEREMSWRNRDKNITYAKVRVAADGKPSLVDVVVEPKP